MRSKRRRRDSRGVPFGTDADGDHSQSPGADGAYEDFGIDGAMPEGRSSVLLEDKAWQETIESVIKSVVSIHFCQTASFDTDGAVASEATGFVVDAERGYIMTNRHVVSPGPFWGYCIFDNHEEVRNASPLASIYADLK